MRHFAGLLSFSARGLSEAVMRSKLLGLFLGFGLVTAAIVPAYACDYQKTNASADQSQQTAQAQPEQHNN